MKALMYPIATEKAINMIEKNNVITYMVDMRATKHDIRKEFESIFNVKVESISTARTMQNTKKAVIKIKKEAKASDIALKLKLI